MAKALQSGSRRASPDLGVEEQRPDRYLPSVTGTPLSDHDIDLRERQDHVSTTMTIGHLLSTLDLSSVQTSFDSYSVTNLWLPIPKQTLRNFFGDHKSEKAFFELQQQMLDESSNDRSFLGTISEKKPFHATFEDGEEVIHARKVLGEGAFGIVEEVLLPTPSGSIVCVRKKIGRPRLLRPQKQVMDAFAREIHVMSQVNHHHCVRFLGSYTDLDTVNILSTPVADMDLDTVNILSTPVADMDLAKFLDLPITENHKNILYKGIGCLCNALLYLHQNKIRHQDLKPQNVLIHGENILLTDFGFSLDFSEDSISTTTGRPSAWTIRYSAPEVLDFEPRNRASDIFSLACVLTEMISGICGFNLIDVKQHWKVTGNSQLSFARNQGASDSWLDRILSMITDLRLGFICRFLIKMLDPVRDNRPSAQWVVDRISDLGNFHLTRPLWTCCDLPSPNSAQNLGIRDRLIQKFGSTEDLAFYLYPSSHRKFAFILLNLNFSIVGSSRTCYRTPRRNIKQLILDHRRIIQKCEKLFETCNRNGATEEFWRRHRLLKGEMPEDNPFEYSDFHRSAHMLSLKHLVFTAINAQIKWPQDYSSDTIELSPNYEKCTLLISLLPNCFARSRKSASFFYMLSFRVSGPSKLSWSGTEDDFVDLTI